MCLTLVENDCHVVLSRHYQRATFVVDAEDGDSVQLSDSLLDASECDDGSRVSPGSYLAFYLAEHVFMVGFKDCYDVVVSL